jgi:hypothetical protein
MGIFKSKKIARICPTIEYGLNFRLEGSILNEEKDIELAQNGTSAAHQEICNIVMAKCILSNLYSNVKIS